MTMNLLGTLARVLGGLGFLITSCSTSSDQLGGRWHQESLGKGIVEGTKGYWELYQEVPAVSEHGRMVTGHVIKIEGGAYVMKTAEGLELRVPHDQNTRIDRPAHVGDWIHVEFDERGRARTIRHADASSSLSLGQGSPYSCVSVV